MPFIFICKCFLNIQQFMDFEQKNIVVGFIIFTAQK
ncbi:hypothetical protein KCQ_16412 [Pectobacterium atrosepticum ICMP 1526]|nr:hypothetical protein KCQ_16412 [Pectobacterium atrosepticum ICMP 1526]